MPIISAILPVYSPQLKTSRRCLLPSLHLNLPEIQRKQLTEQLADFSSVFANMDQLSKLVTWQENKQSESIGKTVLKSEKAAPAEVQTAVLSTDRSINKRQRLMDKSLNVVSQAAKQLGENAPAFADAAAAIATVTLPKAELLPFAERKEGEKTKGRQVVEAKETVQTVTYPMPETPRCPSV